MKFKLTLILSFLVVCCQSVYSQNEDILWNKIGVGGFFTKFSYSFDGKYFALSGGTSVTIINTSDYKIEKLISLDSISCHPSGLTFLPNSYNIAISISSIYHPYNINQINIYNVENDGLIREIPYFDLELNISPDGEKLCLWNNSINKFTILNFETLEIIFEDTIHISSNNHFTKISFSNDSKNICVSAGAELEGEFFVIGIDEKRIIWQYELDINDFLTDATFFSENELLITGYKKLYIINFKNKSIVKSINNPDIGMLNPRSQISDDNKYILTCYGFDIFIRDIEKDELIFTTNIKNIVDEPFTRQENNQTVFFTILPNSEKLITLSENAKLIVWNIKNDNDYDIISGDEFMISGYTNIFDKGKKILTKGINDTFIWDVEDGQKIKYYQLSCSGYSDRCVATLNNSPIIIYQSKNNLNFFNIESSAIESTIKVFEDNTTNIINDIFSSPFDNYLALTTEDSSFYIIDMKIGNIIITEKMSKPISYLSFSNNEQYFVVTLQNSNCIVYSITDLEKVVETYEEAEKNVFNHLTNLLIGIDNSKIIFYDPFYYDKIKKSYEHRDEENELLMIKDFQISNDNQFLITSTYDNKINIWDLNKDTIIKELNGHFDLAIDMDISFDNKILSGFYEGGTIILWNIEKYATPVDEKPIIRNNILNVYPNPTENTINLRYRIETAGMINIFLSDILGNQPLLKSEYKFPGEYTETFNLNGYPQGIYNIVTQAGSQVFSERVVILR